MYKIIGYERCTKNILGVPKLGYRLHLAYSDDKTIGFACTPCYASDSSLNGYIPKLDDIVNFSCDLSGHIVNVEIIDSKYIQ